MTYFADVIVTVQLVPEKLVHPVQVFRMNPGSGVAVSAMSAPFASIALHAPVPPEPHEIPVPATVPLPLTPTLSA